MITVLYLCLSVECTDAFLARHHKEGGVSCVLVQLNRSRPIDLYIFRIQSCVTWAVTSLPPANYQTLPLNNRISRTVVLPFLIKIKDTRILEVTYQSASKMGDAYEREQYVWIPSVAD